MNKKGAGVIFWLFVVLIALVLVVAGVMYSAFFAVYKVPPKKTSEELQKLGIINPAENKSIYESVEVFNESFVLYLLYNIGADRLRNSPFSSNKPKIEFFIDSDLYWAVVDNGVIYVSKQDVGDEDIIIRTSKEEAVKMILDEDYITESFNEGLSTIELVAGKFSLASKGYLVLYEELTGEEEI